MMADPLSISASVVGLLSFGIQVCQGLVSYYSSYKDRNENVEKTTKSIGSLVRNLQNLQTTLENRRFRPGDEPLVQQISQLVESCSEIIDELRRENDKFATEKKLPGFAVATKQSLQKLAYPFREGTLLHLREYVSDIRENLSLAIDLLQVKSVGDLQDDLDDAAKLLATISVNQNTDQIQRWLNAPDPRQNYNNACEKHHPGTGRWLLQHDDFTLWLHVEASFLWLYGVPGCGKTVLSSTIVQHILRLRRAGRTHGVAFYYFDFNDPLKQSSSGLLRSLLLQLSNQLDDGFAELTDLSRNYADLEPPIMALQISLRRLVENFDDVHIVIDAIDECPRGRHRDSVLDVIGQIRKWSLKNLHVLFTSRDESDIRQEASDLGVKPLFVLSREVDKDIAKYVAKKIRSQRGLQKWAKDFPTIETRLTERAQGMFQWVECQFESLRNCRSRDELIQTLNSLPRSLRETYWRIFQRIENSAAKDVKRILTWVCFAREPLTLDALNRILAIRTSEDVKYDEDRCYVDPKDILGVCIGLVSVDTFVSHSDGSDPFNLSNNNGTETLPSTSLRIAHLSVLEYLISDPSEDFSAGHYHLRAPTAHAELAKCCIIYVMEMARANRLIDEPEWDDAYSIHQQGTLDYCARFWASHLIGSGELEDACNMAYEFLTSRFSYIYWKQLVRIPHGDVFLKNILRRFESSSPAFDAARLGLQKTLGKLITTAYTDVNEYISGSALRPQKDITLLQTATRHGQVDCVRLLLDRGADPNLVLPGSWPALHLACVSGHLECAELLLDRGASLNLPGAWEALKEACMNGHTKTVSLLIDRGCNAWEPEQTGTSATTLLHIACDKGFFTTAEKLLMYGSLSNVQDADLNTPLHLASIQANFSIITLLVQNGAERQAKNKHGLSPLFEAASRANLQSLDSVWNSLVYAGWNLDRDAKGDTLLHVLAANLCLEQHEDENPKAIDRILNTDHDLNAQNRDGFTALHLALFHGNFHLATRLMERGCRLDIRSVEDWLPLHSLASCGCDVRWSRYSEIDFTSLIDTLSMDGKVLDSPGAHGLRPSHLVVLAERPNFLEAFVRAGADFTLMDAAPARALDYLCMRVLGPTDAPRGFSQEMYLWILGKETLHEFRQEFGFVEVFLSAGDANQVRSSGEISNIGFRPVISLFVLQPPFNQVSYTSIELTLSDPLACRRLLGMILIYVTLHNEDSKLILDVYRHRASFDISEEHFASFVTSIRITNRLIGSHTTEHIPQEIYSISENQTEQQVADFLDRLSSCSFDDGIDAIKKDLENYPSIVDIDNFLTSRYGVPILTFALAATQKATSFIATVALLELFLAHGANIEGRDSRGNTPLASVAELPEDLFNPSPSPDPPNIDVVRCLIRHGADVETRNWCGHRLIDHARRHDLGWLLAAVQRHPTAEIEDEDREERRVEAEIQTATGPPTRPFILSDVLAEAPPGHKGNSSLDEDTGLEDVELH